MVAPVAGSTCAEALLDEGTDGAHVCASGSFGLDGAHDLAHVANALGTGRADDFVDQRCKRSGR